jgi:hypothetical protein
MGFAYITLSTLVTRIAQSDVWMSDSTHAEAVTVTPVEIKDEPSHEVIMTHWWRHGHDWYRVEAYTDSELYLVAKIPYPASWFANREHAEIPPG